MQPEPTTIATASTSKTKAPRKRGYGSGSVWQKPNGTWTTQHMATTSCGERKRASVSGKTKREVESKLAQALADEARGIAALDGSTTVNEILDAHLKRVATRRKSNTVRAYTLTADKHLRPALGNIPVGKLSRQQVERLLDAKRAEGLSAGAVALIRGVLRAALGTAVKWELVHRNVAALTDAIELTPHEAQMLTPEQASRFLDACDADQHGTLFRTILTCGLRRGEVLSLTFDDIDFERGFLTVNRTLTRLTDGTIVVGPPKSKRSARVIPLPAELVAALRAQRAVGNRLRLRAGTRWGSDFGALVFPSRVNSPLGTDTLSRRFTAILNAAGLPPMRIHDLRHSFASMLAASGGSPKVAMDLLGHSSLEMTLNLYPHTYADDRRNAMEGASQLMRASNQ